MKVREVQRALIACASLREEGHLSTQRHHDFNYEVGSIYERNYRSFVLFCGKQLFCNQRFAAFCNTRRVGRNS